MRNSFSGIILSILFVLSVFASDSFQKVARGPTEFTLEELLGQVMENNPELRSFEADVSIARAQRRQAGSWKNPDVALQYGDRRLTSADGNLAKGYTEGATLTQVFEFPGKASLRKAIADQDLELADLGLKQFQAALIGRVKLLAYRYAANRVQLQTSEQVSDRSGTLIELLRKRPRAGIQALLDSRSLEGNLIELQQIAREAEREKVSILTDLNLLRGQKPSDLIELALTGPSLECKLQLDELIVANKTTNLLLKIRDLELHRAKTQVKASRLAAAPDFSVGPFYSLDKAGERDEKIGLAITLPLPFWNQNEGEIQASKARQSKVEALIWQTNQEADASITRLFNTYTLLQQQIRQIPSNILKHLEEAADLADRHYRLGAVNLQTFFEAQRQLVNVARLQQQTILDAERVLLDLELMTHLSLTSPGTTLAKP